MDCRDTELDITSTSLKEDLWEDGIKGSFEEIDLKIKSFIKKRN